MQLRLTESKKLHYGEYLYKLVIYNKLSSIFRTEFQKDGNLGYARKKLDQCNIAYTQARKDKTFSYTFYLPWQINKRMHPDPIHVDHYFDAIKIYKILKKQENYKIRIEQNQIYIYSNDKTFLKRLINSCEGVGDFWEPALDTIELIQNNKNIIISDKPVIFKYKITLGSKKGNPNLVNWIDANPALAKIGASAKQSCLNNSYVKGYYFFVKNDKALFLAQMIVGDNIQRIDKIVYRNE
jgi:hypothetical protein